MTLKLSLIGTGNFGKIIFSKVEKIPGCEIVYCYHPKEAKAKKFHPKKGTSDLKKAINEVDGVIIATPNDMHTEFIKKAIKAGKHIFVEKPVTNLYKTTLALKPLVKKHRKVFMTGHNKRRDGCFRKTKQIIDSGKLGKIVNVSFNFSHGGAFKFVPSQWRWSAKRHREGPLITLGIHFIDVIHYLFGPVKSVSAVISNLTRKTQAPDCNALLLTLKNGATVFLQSNYNMPSEKICTIYGTEGAIYIDRDKLLLRMGRDTTKKGRYIHSKPKPVKFRKTDSIDEELREFCKAMRGKDKVETGFREGLNALAVIEASYQSSSKHKVVDMKSLKGYWK